MFFRPIRQKKARAVEDIFKVFAKLVFQGKLSAAIKLLDSESSTGLLNLTPEVLEGLKEKHPEEADIAGPSGRDAELYRRILCSKNFKTEGKILRKKEICLRSLTIHLCWKAIPLADSSPWTKTLEYDLLVLVRF